MKYEKLFKVIILISACVFFISCNNKNINIVIFNEIQKEYLINYIIFRNYNIKIINNDNYLSLNKINDKILIDILSMLNLRIDLIRDNIVNVNTTRTANGELYIRNYLKITIENGMEILKDNSPATNNY